MIRSSVILFFSIISFSFVKAQSLLTPETLLSLGRVGAKGLSKDGSLFYYSVAIPSMEENKNKSKFYSIPSQGGQANEIPALPTGEMITVENGGENIKLSPNGKSVIFSREVKMQNIQGYDSYPTLTKSNAQIYDHLNQRHWDTWEDGSYSHVFIADNVAGYALREKDIMAGEMFDAPQKPFGGDEDLMFSPDGNQVLYVTKKKMGKEYAISTNTDIYMYDIASGITTNLTEEMKGYDTNPIFSKDGNHLAWLSMQRDGFEADKNELWVMDWKTKIKQCITRNWDETVSSFRWSDDNNTIFFVAPFHGTEQLFEVGIKLDLDEAKSSLRQITRGQFDINGISDQKGNTLYVTRTDMNRAAEVYMVDITNGSMTALTHINDQAYNGIKSCMVRERYTELENGQQLFSWVIYPPDFDSTKKYSVLLYCQGGPQSALTQFYSFRWNFQLMASNGYIIIAPNRTGMPGWGTKWNEDISKAWGADPMRDYLAAIDDISEENYIDKDRRGAVGASYGGYSVFMLAGIHENRFKTLIAHDGLFDLKSWYGTTEELWFANWDIGGNYWDGDRDADKSYEKYSPSNYIDKWNTPILIYQGGKDYRVPVEQGMQAFQAAQLKDIKSRFIYMPDENHWVLKPQTAMVWHKEFYKWLKETL
ncbi:MAG TPA: S9 family peptidase [Chitinophagaceae bacterium]|nr:S9 family peptidase [Chitinophagaceae bacterium]